jgi:hypothetical protein
MTSVNDPSSRLAQSSTSATPLTSHEAAYAVLNTNELLCEIIGRLPLHDIVNTTGVCRAWRNALKASVAIQQAMFLTPADVQEITTTTKCLSLRVSDIPVHSMPSSQNQIRTLPGSVVRCMGSRALWARTMKFQYENAPLQKFDHPHGTWRNMFLTQPPVKILQVTLWAGRSLFRRSFSCDEGITLGKLHAFNVSTLHGNRRPFVVTSSTPQGWFPERSLSVKDRFNRWWEVRKGKVHRRIEPPNNLIDVTGDVSDADDDGS